jgi:hypothetical protein
MSVVIEKLGNGYRREPVASHIPGTVQPLNGHVSGRPSPQGSKCSNWGRFVAVLHQHLVDYRFDRGQRKHGGGQWIVGDGLENQARVASQCCSGGNTLSLKLTLT